MAKKYVITIDMGGTKILGAAINSKEGIVARIKQPTKEGAQPKEYVTAIVEVVNKVIKSSNIKQQFIQAVCLGIPGSVNPELGKIGLAPNLGLKNFFIKDKLKALIDYPVLIENDVNLAALGIKNFELTEKSKNILVVFVGTGIGGGLIFDGKIYRGSTFVAGEIGHRVIENLQYRFPTLLSFLEMILFFSFSKDYLFIGNVLTVVKFAGGKSCQS